MKITSREQLKRLDDWRDSSLLVLDRPNIEKALGATPTAIGVYFMGHSADGSHAQFQLKYVGKAVEQPLYKRLTQHVRASHNDRVRSALAAAASKTGDPVYFRFAVFTSVSLAEEVEGLSIAAFLWHVDKATGKTKWTGWNKRNEWSQHWPEGQE